MRVRLNSLSQSLDANSWGAGATAGILWQPSPATSIGLGYRSAITQDLSGLVIQSPLGFEAKGSVTLPDEVTLSARQALTDRLATLLGTVEWQNQSSVGNIPLRAALSAAPAECAKPSTSITMADGMLLVAREVLVASLTVRTGVNYEISPRRQRQSHRRAAGLHRLGVERGRLVQVLGSRHFRLAYTHLFFDNAHFCMAEAAARCIAFLLCSNLLC